MAEDLSPRESMLQSMARTETKVEALTGSVKELKQSVEELVDRIEADIDTLRTKAESIAVVQQIVADLQRRVTSLEADNKTTNVRIGFASGASSMLSVLLKLLWR